MRKAGGKKLAVIGIKAGLYAIQNPNTQTLVISAVERQAYLLFERILGFLLDNHKDKIMKGSKRPTKHIIWLKNGSKIMCYPTGLSG